MCEQLPQWPTDPLREDTPHGLPAFPTPVQGCNTHVLCVQWRWRNHHKAWSCTKGHVWKLEKAIPETQGRLSRHARSRGTTARPSQDAPWKDAATLQQPKVTACQLPGPGSSRRPPNNPAGCTLPSAFVSVLPSSSRRGVSCSRVGRKENKCRNMDQI